MISGWGGILGGAAAAGLHDRGGRGAWPPGAGSITPGRVRVVPEQAAREWRLPAIGGAFGALLGIPPRYVGPSVREPDTCRGEALPIAGRPSGRV